jgi:hypothetical protein
MMSLDERVEDFSRKNRPVVDKIAILGDSQSEEKLKDGRGKRPTQPVNSGVFSVAWLCSKDQGFSGASYRADWLAEYREV